MGKPISAEEIPEPSSGGRRTSWLSLEIDAFLESGSPAWELKEYNSVNSARSTVTRLNVLAKGENLPFEAVARNTVVYLRRTDPVAVPKPKAKKSKKVKGK